MRLTGTPSWLRTRQGEAARGDPPRSPDTARTRIWAIGGGKGGVGKTFISANLATVVARTGRRVILIDADLGGANLHTCLGVRGGERVNLSDYFEDRITDLDKAALETPIPGLRLILGTLGHAGKAETTRQQRARLIEAVRELPADLVIFDLAAGCDRSTVDFFLEADDGFLVTTPEPTSIENAYAFLRATFFRSLAHAMQTSPVREVVRLAMDQRNERGIRTPVDLLREIDRLDATEGARFREVLSDFRPKLIVNQVRSSDEVKMGFSVSSVCRKFFGVDVDYVGYINLDDHVWKSVKDGRPLVLGYPRSDGALYLRRIVKKLLGG
ncbi:MAG: P-loop NTPase [Myxococcota bacterium]